MQDVLEHRFSLKAISLTIDYMVSRSSVENYSPLTDQVLPEEIGLD